MEWGRGELERSGRSELAVGCRLDVRQQGTSGTGRENRLEPRHGNRVVGNVEVERSVHISLISGPKGPGRMQFALREPAPLLGSVLLVMLRSPSLQGAFAFPCARQSRACFSYALPFTCV